MIKTTTLLKGLILLFVGLVSNVTASELKLQFEDDATYRVIVNQTQEYSGSQEIIINKLKSGYHAISIQRQVRSCVYDNSIGRSEISRGVYLPKRTSVTALFSSSNELYVLNMVAKTRVHHDNQNNGHHNRRGNGNRVGNNRGNHTANPIRNNTNQFDQAFVHIKNEYYDRDQIKLAESLLPRNSLTSAQLRKVMELLYYDSDQAKLARTMANRVTDPHNLSVVTDLLYYSSDRLKLMQYVAVNVTSNQQKIQLYDQEFASILRVIKNEYYDSDQMKMAELCLNDVFITSQQLRQILELLYYDSDRLKLAKSLSKSISDPHNINDLLSSFRYSGSKSNLIAYMKH